MRGFLIFLCIALTQAERLGYNYASGGSHNAFDRFRHRSSSQSSSASSGSNSKSNTNDNTNSNTRNNNSNSRIASRADSGLSGYSTDSIQSPDIADPIAVETEYNKEFFSYAAPEEDFNDIEALERLASSMRKNLRVVFIRTPENKGLENAALQLAQQNAESKTAIYVLTKQTDVGDLANKLQNIQHSASSKPDVHFIKYRTPEDALRAQNIIQSEYDALDGPSRFSNEGIAPVLDFSSQKEEVSNNRIGSVAGSSQLSSSSSSSGYLPPSKFRH